MSEDIKIFCKNCVYWKHKHCENFSSKWMGMVTSPNQNCGQFKPKKQPKKKKEEENKKDKDKEK